MAVSIDDVRQIAALARIGLTDERATSLVAELNGILDHMDVLTRATATTAERVAVSDSDRQPLQPDVGPAVHLERSLETFAPSTQDGFLLVPRLATHEAGEES